MNKLKLIETVKNRCSLTQKESTDLKQDYRSSNNTFISIWRAAAKRQIFTILMFLFPNSTLLMYVLSRPASSANFSWDRSFDVLRERNFLPKAVLIFLQSFFMMNEYICLDDYKSTDYKSHITFQCPIKYGGFWNEKDFLSYMAARTIYNTSFWSWINWAFRGKVEKMIKFDVLRIRGWKQFFHWKSGLQ